MKRYLIILACAAVACSEDSPTAPTVTPSPVVIETVEVVDDAVEVVEEEDWPEDRDPRIPNAAPLITVALCRPHEGQVMLARMEMGDREGQQLTTTVRTEGVPEGTFELVRELPADRQWLWTPAPGFSGDVWFKFTATDHPLPHEEPLTTEAVADCTVPELPPPPPPNEPPTVTAQCEVREDGEGEDRVYIKLWADANDPDGDPLEYLWTVNGAGRWLPNRHTAHAGWVADTPGTYTFTVGVSDGEARVTATATCECT